LSWTGYVSLLIGIVTISRGSPGDTLGLNTAVGLQATNIIGCDLVNFTVAAIEILLLRRPRVREFLQQANRGILRPELRVE
jgi:hypothetical protein